MGSIHSTGSTALARSIGGAVSTASSFTISRWTIASRWTIGAPIFPPLSHIAGRRPTSITIIGTCAFTSALACPASRHPATTATGPRTIAITPSRRAVEPAIGKVWSPRRTCMSFTFRPMTWTARSICKSAVSGWTIPPIALESVFIWTAGEAFAIEATSMRTLSELLSIPATLMRRTGKTIAIESATARRTGEPFAIEFTARRRTSEAIAVHRSSVWWTAPAITPSSVANVVAAVTTLAALSLRATSKAAIRHAGSSHRAWSTAPFKSRVSRRTALAAPAHSRCAGTAAFTYALMNGFDHFGEFFFAELAVFILVESREHFFRVGHLGTAPGLRSASSLGASAAGFTFLSFSFAALSRGPHLAHFFASLGPLLFVQLSVLIGVELFE
jgi:hypothetical protein